MVDDNTVILVGSTDGPEDADPLRLDPNGWVLDLTRKTPPRRFTNGHSAALTSVSVGYGMVATTSSTLDPVLRVSDLKSGKAVAEVKLAEPDRFQNAIPSFNARWPHKSPRLAVQVGEQIALFDPKLPTKRTEYRLAPGSNAFLFRHFAVSRDDERIACVGRFRRPDGSSRGDVVFVWTVGKAEPVAIPTVPEDADDPNEWRIGRVTFGPDGTLLALRTGPGSEVPNGVAEKDAPADRRAVVRIDPDRKRAIATGMGMHHSALHCAFDPSGTWLALAGHSRPDRPNPKDGTFYSELRVYHFATARLVHREQVLARMALSWVAFSPSGKRLCAATGNGVLHWWDVEPAAKE